MSTLIAKLESAQRSAGELVVVMENLDAKGLNIQSEAEKKAAAAAKAQDLLNQAERAWYAYAGLCDVGPERLAAFAIYENVRRARCV